MTKAVTIVVLAGALALGVCAASGAQTPTSSQTLLNPQWSGYVVTGKDVSYTSISGTWTEPVMSCTAGAAPALSAAWVGLGGLTTKSLQQVGVDANCDAKGHPAYFAWFEILPDVAHNVAEKIEPGDVITGTVKRIGLALVELRVQNLTRHWTFDRKITWGAADVSSAEWIVEAPFACKRFICQTSHLANFGSLSFHNVAAVGNGHRGSLFDPAWTTTQIDLAPCVRTKTSPRAGATPTPTSNGGTIFGVSWIRDAGQPSPCKGPPGSLTVGVVPDYTSP
jgi:Peptidase A4 family